MPLFNGMRQKLRGGGNNGRGDQPYPSFGRPTGGPTPPPRPTSPSSPPPKPPRKNPNTTGTQEKAYDPMHSMNLMNRIKQHESNAYEAEHSIGYGTSHSDAQNLLGIKTENKFKAEELRREYEAHESRKPKLDRRPKLPPKK